MYLNRIGHESLEAFVRTIQSVVTNDSSFDFIVAASDSGQLAACITEEVHQLLNKEAPPKFIFPIYRHIDKERTILFDNSILATQYAEWRNVKLGHILFIDDEIWRGDTLNGVFDLLLSLNSTPRSCTVVAEDGGFHCSEVMRGIRTKFMPTKQRVPDIYNAFSYTVPKEFQKPVKKALENKVRLNDKQVMCTLLSLPVKEWNNGNPRFTEGLIKQVRAEVSGFSEIQKQYKKWLKDTIRGYLIA